MHDIDALQIAYEHLRRERLAEAAHERLIAAAVDRVGLRIALGTFLLNIWAHRLNARAGTRHCQPRAARDTTDVGPLVQEA